MRRPRRKLLAFSNEYPGGIARELEASQTEVALLRRALLDALTVFDIGEGTKFRAAYAELIARADAAEGGSRHAGA